MAMMLNGCFIAKKIAGADIDAEQFARAREAKMYEIRSVSSGNLARRIAKGDSFDNADITFYLSEDFLNKIAAGYNEASGWLDGSTPYLIKKVDIKLHNGSAIASVAMIAKNTKYNVDVFLTMDCILTFQAVGNDLALKMEPFNISPNVSTGALLSSAEEIIQNLIKINLANIGNSMPQIKIPMNIENKMYIPGSRTTIKDKVNLLVVSPQRELGYKLKITDILFFEKKTLVALNIEKVEVK